MARTELKRANEKHSKYRFSVIKWIFQPTKKKNSRKTLKENCSCAVCEDGFSRMFYWVGRRATNDVGKLCSISSTERHHRARLMGSPMFQAQGIDWGKLVKILHFPCVCLALLAIVTCVKILAPIYFSPQTPCLFTIFVCSACYDNFFMFALFRMDGWIYKIKMLSQRKRIIRVCQTFFRSEDF